MQFDGKGPAIALSRFVTQRPLLSLSLGAVLFAGLALGLPQVRANFTHTAFFEADDPALVRFEAFERRFGNDDSVVIAVHSPSGIFDESSAKLLRELTDRMWKVAEVIRVDSLANFQWVHAQGDDIEIEPLLPDDVELTPELLAARKKIALEHELLPGYLVSEDAKTALVYARIKPGIDAPPNAERIVAETRAAVDGLDAGDHVFHLTGGPIVNDAFRSISSRDLSILVPALLLMVVLLLVATFRRVGSVVMALTVIAVTVVGTIALAGFTGVEMSSVTTALPQVLIAVCVADAVHLLSGFYRALRRGLPRREAAAYTLQKNFVPTLLTSISTALGFFSFLSANLRPIEGFGLLAGLGTVLAWLVTYLWLGPLLALWPTRVPAVPVDAAPAALQEATPRTRALVAFIDRHRLAIITGFGVLSLGAVLIGSRNIVNSNPFDYFRRGTPVREAQDFVLGNLSGIAMFELVVDAGREEGIKDPEFMKKLETFEARAVELPGIGRTISLVDILRQMNRALAGGDDADYKLPSTREGIAQELLLYTMGLPQGMDVNDRVTVKNDALRVTLISNITDSNTAIATATKLEAMGRELGLDVRATGKNLLYQSMNGHVVVSFLRSLAMAVVLIGLMMLAAFRSLKLGLISAIPNVVPLLVGSAVLYFLSGALDIGTVLVSSVCLGIAVDNTIHLLSGYNAHVTQGDSPSEALARTLAHSGPAMLTTTLILIAGFSTLAFGTFIPNVYFGLLTAVILGVGFLTDMVLLPAVLLMISSPRARTTDQGVPATAPPAAQNA